MTVREIIIHPEWNYTGLQHDYAILRTEENITFSNRANAACLPNWTNSSKTDGQKLIISGWGAIAKEYDYNNETVATFPVILQVGSATGYSRSECCEIMAEKWNPDSSFRYNALTLLGCQSE